MKEINTSKDSRQAQRSFVSATQSVIDTYIEDVTGKRKNIGILDKMALAINAGASPLLEHQRRENPDVVFREEFTNLIQRIEEADIEKDSERARYVRALCGKIALNFSDAAKNYSTHSPEFNALRSKTSDVLIFGCVYSQQSQEPVDNGVKNAVLRSVDPNEYVGVVHPFGRFPRFRERVRQYVLNQSSS